MIDTILSTSQRCRAVRSKLRLFLILATVTRRKLLNCSGWVPVDASGKRDVERYVDGEERREDAVATEEVMVFAGWGGK